MSQTSNADKIRPAWLVMEIEEIVDISTHISLARGQIKESNFLPTKQFEMPVITKGFEGVDEGDVVKLVYFTTKSQLDRYVQKKSAGFVDTGLSYFRLGGDGWEMIYEDHAENPQSGG